MKLRTLAAAMALAGLMWGSGGPASAQSCQSTCTAAHDQCESAGRDDTVCLNAWHRCRIGCTVPQTTPAHLQVTRPSPNTVVIKTVPARKK